MLNSTLYPRSVQNLIELFAKLPGIGPRQAARFAFFILKEGGNYSESLSNALEAIRKNVSLCSRCFRSVEKQDLPLCTFCKDTRRDNAIIAVVEKESDMQNLEKTNLFHGLYHVLGGNISPLDANSPKKIRLTELFERIKKMLEEYGECEIILATNPTTEGDTTALYIERILDPLKEQFPKLKISRLGRGLSLGSELEHVDETTLKNALSNRR